MTDLKRDPIKYIRDAVKYDYKKGTNCRICNDTENLQYHHYYSVSALWYKWVLKNNIKTLTVEDIHKQRIIFIEEHKSYLVDEAVTLCKECHNNKLHKVYGKAPALGTAKKQKNWVEIQRKKNGLD